MMFEAVGLFLLGLALLALGGDSVVKAAAGLARHFGLSPFVAGLVLVAFATSLPEIAVNLHAILRGQQMLALGNAVGSNIVNFGLTLGAAALAAPILVRWRALNPMLLVLIIGTIAVIVMGLDGVLSRVEGALLLLAFAVTVTYAVLRGREETPELKQEISGFALTSTDLGLNLLRLVIAAALLYFGSRMIVVNAPIVGSGMGMAMLLTGLIPVAIGTALPEVAAAVFAARRGQGDMVIGHVIGSSVFNLLVVVGGMAAINTLPLPASFVRFELPAALLLALMLVPMLRGDMSLSRREGGVLLVAFVGWLALELLYING